MNIPLRLRILAAGVAVSSVACGGGGSGGGSGGGASGGDALRGTWVQQVSDPNEQDQLTLLFAGDGSASIDVSIANPPQGATCSGSLRETGYKWSDTETTVKITGSGKCSSNLVCKANGQNLPFKCTNGTMHENLTCTYSLSADEDTLDFSKCQMGASSSGPETFKRKK